MRLSTFFLCVSFFLAFSFLHAQKVSSHFRPVIKESPYQLNIIQNSDGNYFIYGDINYYQNTGCGALIKVDKNGNLVPGFKKVAVDAPVNKVAILPSGKILIQGDFAYLNEKRVGGMILLNEDGSQDPGFAVDKNINIKNFAIQSSGKIVIGYLPSASGTFAYTSVGRINSDGSKDDTFPTHSLTTYMSKLKLGLSDEIYIGSYLAIIRLNPDGAKDKDFALKGIDSFTEIEEYAIQNDGKLLVSSSQRVSMIPFVRINSLKRYHKNGEPDGSFTSSEASQQITEIIIRKNGNIAVTGYFTIMGGKSGNAMEMNSDGTMIRSLLSTNHNLMGMIYEDSFENLFLTGGFTKVNGTIDQKYIVKINPSNLEVDNAFKVPVSNTAGSSFSPLAIQKDGKLLIGSTFLSNGVGNDNSPLARVGLNGVPDTTFKAVVKNKQRFSSLEIGVQEDNKIIVGGDYVFNNLSPSLGRLMPNGEFDNSFLIGTGPTRLGYAGTVISIRIKNEKIYVAGYFDNFNGEPYNSLVILNLDGKIIGPLQSLALNIHSLQEIELQSDGKIILMGRFQAPSGYTHFMRLNADGSVDSTFSINLDGNLNDFEIDAHDNIIVCGNNLTSGNSKTLARFKPDGSLDNSLVLGTGFSINSTSSFLTLYQVKALANDVLAIGGLFDNYKDVSTPGIVFLNQKGDILPFDNPFDPRSFPIRAVYSDKALYMIGRFSTEYGQRIESGAKILFDIDNTATSYKVSATSDSTILLSWSGSFTGAEQIKIERSTPGNSSYEVVNTIPVNSTSYLAGQLNEITPYHFRISGVNEFYSSSLFEGNDTTFIKQPVALPATEITSNSFIANWIYAVGTDSCMLQVSKDNFNTFVAGYEKLILTSGSKLVEGLDKREIYKYRVKRFRHKKSSEFSNIIEVGEILGLSHEGNTNAIQAFPNPTTDRITVQLPPNITSASAILYSSGGLKIGAYRLNSALVDIDISSLPVGIFLLTVTYDNKSLKRIKIMKTR